MAMRELALYHFEDKIIPRPWIHPDFPQVSLTLVPPETDEDISVRFAMWTIAATVRFILEENRFQSVQFTAFYRHAPVGSVRLFPTGSLHAAAAQDNSSFQQSRPLELATAASNHTDGYFNFDLMRSGVAENANDQLRAEVDYLTKSIERRDMFFMLIWLLLGLAPHNREPMIVWRVAQDAVTCAVTTLWNRVKQTQYQITKGDMISFLASLPGLLLRDNVFREMNIAIKDGDVVVARGSFRTEPLASTPSIAVS